MRVRMGISRQFDNCESVGETRPDCRKYRPGTPRKLSATVKLHAKVPIFIEVDC